MMLFLWRIPRKRLFLGWLSDLMKFSPDNAVTTFFSPIFRPAAPLVVPVMSLIVGIVCARFLPISMPTAVGGMVGTLVAAAVVIFFVRSVPRGVVALTVCLFFVAAGAVRVMQVRDYLPADHLWFHCPPEGRLATIRGQVLDVPILHDPDGPAGHQRAATRFTIAADAVMVGSAWQELRGRCDVVVSAPMLQLDAGDELTLAGWLYRNEAPDNPGSYDSRLTDLTRGDHTVLYVDTVAAVQVVDARASMSPARRCSVTLDAFRRRLGAILTARTDGHAAHDHQAGFLASLVLGQRGDLAAEDRMAFIRSGTMHFLSVSGLHVGFVVMFLLGFGRLMRLGDRALAVFLIVGIAAYVLIVPSRPPVLRAGIMAAIWCLGFAFRRPFSSLNAMAAAALVILLWRPLDVFNAGFQLSFVIVLALLVFYAPFRAALVRLARYLTGRSHVRLIERTRPSLPRRVGHYLGRKALSLLTMCVIAALAGAPLAAFHFHQVSVAGIVGSFLLAVPIMVVMFLSLLKLLLAAVLPILMPLCDALIWPLSDGILSLCRQTASAPVVLYCGSVPLWMVLSFYAIGGVLFAGLYYRPAMIRWSLAAGVLWTVVFGAFVPFAPRDFARTTSVSVLSVSHGLAVIVRTPDGSAWCYDGGAMFNPSVGRYTLIPFCRWMGITDFQTMFVSHLDADHYGGLADLAAAVRPGVIYAPTGAAPARRSDEEFFNAISALDLPLHFAHSGMVPDAFGDPAVMRIEVLWPDADYVSAGTDSAHDNNGSLVLRMTSPDGSVLLCGDIGASVQRELVARDASRLRCDVLVLPHHGRADAALSDFAAAVNPKVVICSSGRMVERRRTALGQVLGSPWRDRLCYTDRSGAICVLMHDGAIDIRHGHDVAPLPR